MWPVMLHLLSLPLNKLVLKVWADNTEVHWQIGKLVSLAPTLSWLGWSFLDIDYCLLFFFFLFVFNLNSCFSVTQMAFTCPMSYNSKVAQSIFMTFLLMGWNNEPCCFQASFLGWHGCWKYNTVSISFSSWAFWWRDYMKSILILKLMGWLYWEYSAVWTGW